MERLLDNGEHLRYNPLSDNWEIVVPGIIPLKELVKKEQLNNYKFDRYDDGMTVFVLPTEEQLEINTFVENVKSVLLRLFDKQTKELENNIEYFKKDE